MSYTFFQCWLGRNGCFWRKRTQSPQHPQSQTDEPNGDFLYMISALLFEVVSFLPLPSCKACVKETPTMLLGSPFLRSPQTRQLCPAGSMQLTFCYFSSIWVFFFFAVSFWMAVACQQRLCTNPHHSHISAWNQCPAGGVLRVLHPQLQCTEWRKMQTRCFSKNCGLLFAACCSQSVWGASLLQLETLMKTRATNSPALISCPFPCHCHEVKETLLSAQINFILSSLIRVYPWIKHLHCAFTEVYCLDFVVLSSLWYREKKFQVFKLSVATAVLAGCGFSMWQALGCQWMHAFVMSAEWAAHFSRTEASVPDCQQMQWNHMKVCGLFFK